MFIITATYKGNDKKYDKKIRKLIGRDFDRFYVDGKITVMTWERKSVKSWDRICRILGKLRKIEYRYIIYEKDDVK